MTVSCDWKHRVLHPQAGPWVGFTGIRVVSHLHPQLLAGSLSGPCMVATSPASPWGPGNGVPLLGISVPPSCNGTRGAPLAGHGDHPERQVAQCLPRMEPCGHRHPQRLLQRLVAAWHMHEAGLETCSPGFATLQSPPFWAPGGCFLRPHGMSQGLPRADSDRKWAGRERAPR